MSSGYIKRKDLSPKYVFKLFPILACNDMKEQGKTSAENTLMETGDQPCLIDLGKIGNGEIGYITVCEFQGKLPFQAKRVYWTYLTPENVERGNHAHKNLEQIIVAVSGQIDFELEDVNGVISRFRLHDPAVGLYIPKLHWRRISFTKNAVLLCIASEEYLEQDYIRDYENFRKTKA